MKKVFLSALACGLLLTACEENPPPVKERPSGSFAFKAHDAELINASVEVYAVDEYLQPIGDPIAEGLTGEDARFHFKPNIASQTVYVRAGKTGHYFEESTGTKIELAPTDYLSGVIHYEAGDVLDFTVSGYTHLATAYAQCLIRRYGENQQNAMTLAASAFTNLVGVDIYDVIPLNPSVNSSAGLQLDSETIYGTVHAGVSQFMKRVAENQGIEAHSTNYRSIDYFRFGARDISEDKNCALDGKVQDKDGSEVTLGLGTYLFSDDTYRVDVARDALAFLRSDRNLTAISDTDFMLSADNQSKANNSRLFQGIDPTPLDDEPPTVTLGHANYEYFGGNASYHVSATDFTGIQYVDLWVDETYIGRVLSTEDVTFTIPTTDFTDGQHVVEVLVVDNQFKETRVQQTINIWNSGPIITLDSESRTNQLVQDVTVNLSSPAGLAPTAQIDGQVVSVVDGKATATVELNPGVNQVVVTATDSLGKTTTSTVSIAVDRVRPVATVLTPDGYYSVSYSGSASANHTYSSVLVLDGNSDPLYIDSNLESLDGTPLNVDALKESKYAFLRFMTTDDLGTQDPSVITPAKEIAVSFTYRRNDDLVFEKKPMVALGTTGINSYSYILPLTTEYLGDSWFLSPEATTHELEVFLVDLAGNESSYTYQFKIRYFPDELAVAVKAVETRFVQVSLPDLVNELGKEHIADIELFNPNPFPVKTVFTDIGNDAFEEVKNIGIRVNKLNKRIVSTASAKCAAFSQTALPKTDTGQVSSVKHHGESQSFSASSGATISLGANDYIGRQTSSGFVTTSLASLGHVGDVTTEIDYLSDLAPLPQEPIIKPTLSSTVSGLTTLLSGGFYSAGKPPYFPPSDNRWYKTWSHGTLITKGGNRWGCPLQSAWDDQVYWNDLFSPNTGTGTGTVNHGRHSFNSSPITINQKITYGGVVGYPRNDVLVETATENKALEIRDLENQPITEAVLEPGLNVFRVVSPIPVYEVVSTDCEWVYGEQKTCTKRVDVSSNVSVDYTISAVPNDQSVMPSFDVEAETVSFTSSIR